MFVRFVGRLCLRCDEFMYEFIFSKKPYGRSPRYIDTVNVDYWPLEKNTRKLVFLSKCQAEQLKTLYSDTSPQLSILLDVSIKEYSVYPR